MFCLFVLFHLVIVLSVLGITTFDYPFGIFKLFCDNITDHINRYLLIPMTIDTCFFICYYKLSLPHESLVQNRKMNKGSWYLPKCLSFSSGMTLMLFVPHHCTNVLQTHTKINNFKIYFNFWKVWSPLFKLYLYRPIMTFVYKWKRKFKSIKHIYINLNLFTYFYLKKNTKWN